MIGSVLRGLTFPLFYPLSYVYQLGVYLDRRRRWPRREHFPVPVFSVGNITIGGTGKTPILIRLAQDLLAMGRRPGVLSRGYRGPGRLAASGGVFASGTAGNPENRSRLNDEAVLVARAVPRAAMGVGPDRRTHGKTLLHERLADCLILDDGFQHWDIDRNLDIVCVDATDPWGGGHLLPAGRLREAAGALRRADLVVLTRTELVEADQLSELRERVLKRGGPRVIASRFMARVSAPGSRDESDGLSSFNEKDVIALSAIGHPEAFEEGLRVAGARVTPWRLSDHADYSDTLLADVERRAVERKALVAVTEKDWVKIQETNWGVRPPAFLRVVRIEVQWMEGDEPVWRDAIAKSLQAAPR